MGKTDLNDSFIVYIPVSVKIQIEFVDVSARSSAQLCKCFR